MKKLFIAAAIASLAFTATAKDIVIGTEATYAPFEFYNDKNEIVGFDIDIINEVCQEIKASCKIVNQSFDSLIPSLKTRRIDAAIAGIDITPERSEQVDFTQIYYDDSSIQFIALANGVKSIDELKGKRVGIQNGTTYQQYLHDKYSDLKIVNYDSYQYAILDLKAGRIDGIVSSSLVANEWIEKESEIVALGDKILDHEYFGEGLGIAVRKGNSALLDQFNQALDTLRENGKLDEIYQKWFSK